MEYNYYCEIRIIDKIKCKKRNRVQIIFEILENLYRRSMSSSELIRRVNLNFDLGKKIISLLEEQCLVKKVERRIEITEEGVRILNYLRELKKMTII